MFWSATLVLLSIPSSEEATCDAGRSVYATDRELALNATRGGVIDTTKETAWSSALEPPSSRTLFFAGSAAASKALTER